MKLIAMYLLTLTEMAVYAIAQAYGLPDLLGEHDDQENR